MKTNRYLVTGVSSGIGAAIAHALVSNNNEVLGVSRRTRALLDDSLSSTQGFQYASIDLTDFSALETSLSQLVKAEDKLDGLVLCHGYGDFGSIEQFSESRIRKIVDTNLVSYMLILRFLLPRLKKQGYGKVVVIGSEAALKGSRRGAIYCATKFGLRGLIQSLRQECSASGVGISLINPGMVATPFFDDLDFSPGESRENYLESSDVAQVVNSVLNMPVESVIDEVNLSPLKNVVTHKKANDK